MPNTAISVEEHVHGATVWVAVRARGADWSWITPAEAARLGQQWVAQYASSIEVATAPSA